MIQNMAFTPATGLNDATYSKETPDSEASIRSQIQGVSDQLKDFINNTLIPSLENIITNGNGASIIGTEAITGLQININGTVSKTAGSAILTGIGTNFTTQLQVGQYLTVIGETCKIISIASDTSLTVNANYLNTLSGQIAFKANDVMTLIQALKTYVDGTFVTQSSVYTQTQLNNGQLDTRYFTQTQINTMLANVVLGQIPNNSLTQIQMANDMKKGIANGLASLGSDSKVLSVQLPAIADADNGRYQSDFGLDTAVLSNCILDSNNILSLDNIVGSSITLTATGATTSTTAKNGIQILANSNISRLTLTLGVGYSGGKTLYIRKSSDLSLVTSKDITGLIAGNSITIDANLLTGISYDIVVDANGSSFIKNYYTSATYPIASTDFNAVAGIWENAVSSTIIAIFSSIAVYTKTITGTATKTITPSDIKKWGNAKWTQTTVASGSTVVCDITEVLDNTKSIIPLMTSDNTPSGIVSSDKTIVSTHEPYTAFDGIRTMQHGWEVAYISGILQYQFPSVVAINKYVVEYNWNDSIFAPKNWTFEGSNDGTSWTVLDTQTNITNWTISLLNTKIYNIPNTTKYLYYRINISANNGGASLIITQLSMMRVEDVLQSSIISIADLSNIDITAYPNIKVRWTLTRLLTTDTSPTVSNVSVTWEGNGFIKLLSASGYQKLPSGLIIQWGSFSAIGTVTFPIAFPTACQTVSPNSTTSTVSYYTAKTVSNFTVAGGTTGTYIAIGY